jgi:hypothetical protein
MAGFRIEVEVRKQGRMMATCLARLVGQDGKLCVEARSVHLQVTAQGELPTVEAPPPPFDGAVQMPFPLASADRSHPTFVDAVETRYPPGQADRLGPKSIWMRTPPLLAGEEMSGFQRLCPLADCGNGFAANGSIDEATFMNPDLTVAIHRVPEGEWLASTARCFWQPTGLGLSEATLFDRKGAVGVATQTLLVARRP